jgi:hypothetical protein
VNFLPRMALNHNPPDLCLLSSQDYRHEPPEPDSAAFFFFLSFSFITLWPDSMQEVISIFLHLLMHCDPKYDLSGRKFHELLRRMNILLLQHTIL